MIQIKRPRLGRLSLAVGLALSLALPVLPVAAATAKKKPAAVQKAKHASKMSRHVLQAAERHRSAPKKTAVVAGSRTRKGRTVAGLAAGSAGVAAASAAHVAERRHEAAQAPDSPPRLSANAVFVMDQNSREVLVSKNDKAVMPIASLTKLMTGLLVADAKLPLDEEITITEDDLDIYKGTGSRLAVGTRLTRGEALHLALMSSENRAAHALGRTYPGGVVNFVRLMNAKAAELGMRDTRYVEPTGLSVENRSSARDLALLVAAAYQRPLLREFTTSQGYAFESGRRVLQYHNSNRLTADPKWDIGLQKTGYIAEAGRCMVMSARMAGRQVIMVLLDASDKASRLGDAQRVRRYVESVASADPIERIALGRI